MTDVMRQVKVKIFGGICGSIFIELSRLFFKGLEINPESHERLSNPQTAMNGASRKSLLFISHMKLFVQSQKQTVGVGQSYSWKQEMKPRLNPKLSHPKQGRNRERNRMASHFHPGERENTWKWEWSGVEGLKWTHAAWKYSQSEWAHSI